MLPTFSGHIQTYSIIFRPYSDIFGHIRTYSDIFKHIRTIFGHIRTYSNIFGPYSDHIRVKPMDSTHGSNPWVGPWAGPMDRARPQAKPDFLAYDINKKDAQCPYDPFAGGIAPRSLLCVRKQMISFLPNTPYRNRRGDSPVASVCGATGGGITGEQTSATVGG